MNSKKTLQDFLDAGRAAPPVTSPEEIRSMVEHAAQPAPRVAQRLFHALTRKPMNIVASSMAGAALVGATAWMLSHPQLPTAPTALAAAQSPTAQVQTSANRKPETGNRQQVIIRETQKSDRPLRSPDIRLPYRGMLTESSGAPLQGAHRLILNMYDTEQGGASIWRETQHVVLDSLGDFSVELGNKTPLTMDPSSAYWMGVSVDGGKEMSPRMKLDSLPIVHREFIRIEKKIHGEIGANTDVSANEGPRVIESPGTGRAGIVASQNADQTVGGFVITGVIPDNATTATHPSKSTPGHFLVQTILYDTVGHQLTGRHRVTAMLFRCIDDSVPVWSESHPVTLKQPGKCKVSLGTIVPLPAELTGPYWLATSVDGGPEQMDRTIVRHLPDLTTNDQLEIQYDANDYVRHRLGLRQARSASGRSLFDSSTIAAFAPHVGAADMSCVQKLAEEVERSRVRDSANREMGLRSHARNSLRSNAIRDELHFETAADPQESPNGLIARDGRREGLTIKRHGDHTRKFSHTEVILDYQDATYDAAPVNQSDRASIDYTRMITLDRDGLARLGLFPDAHGVWATFTDSNQHGLAPGAPLKHVGMNGTFDAAIEGLCWLSTTAPVTIRPVAMTDDEGRLREFIYDRTDTIQSTVKDFALDPDIVKKAELDVMKRVSTLVPVLVHSNAGFTEHDRALKLWHPDLILWYEPTEQFLKTLPETDRAPLTQQLSAVGCMVRKIDSGVVSSDCQAAIERAHPVEATPAPNLFIDNEPTNAKPFYLDLFRSAAGAITSSIVFPNPAVDHITIQYTLSEPRIVKFSLHDIRGHLIRDLATPRESPVGPNTVQAALENVRPGMYLLALTTGKGEQAVQRLIVVDKK